MTVCPYARGIFAVADSVLRADANVGKDGLLPSGISCGMVCEIVCGRKDFTMVQLFFAGVNRRFFLGGSYSGYFL
ncbi:MAG: hypothetical protein DBX55_02085 [Verrucomicrobia bacterium]|nr:MAG: hypothetical protein DBX55_02085 [Verrucomicrobiota bacterium]